jgi:hypothetical protein
LVRSKEGNPWERIRFLGWYWRDYCYFAVCVLLVIGLASIDDTGKCVKKKIASGFFRRKTGFWDGGVTGQRASIIPGIPVSEGLGLFCFNVLIFLCNFTDLILRVFYGFS